MEQADQRSYGCPIPESVQGQIVWGPGQLGLVEHIPSSWPEGWNSLVFKEALFNSNHSSIL